MIIGMPLTEVRRRLNSPPRKIIRDYSMLTRSPSLATTKPRAPCDKAIPVGVGWRRQNCVLVWSMLETTGLHDGLIRPGKRRLQQQTP